MNKMFEKIRWYFIKKKYKVKDLEDLPEEEQLKLIEEETGISESDWIHEMSDRHIECEQDIF